jgi:hypothetical protein
MRKYPLGQLPAVAVIAIALTMSLVGCGGGSEDPTSVALRPNKEQPQGATGTNTNAQDPVTNGSAAPEGGFGGITGQIVIADADKGNVPPPEIKLFDVGKAPVQPQFCAAKTPILNESLLVNPGSGGIKNVFFYLEKKPKGGKPAAEVGSQKLWPTAGEPGSQLVLDQQNCTFSPHAMIVLAGVPFTAKSQDTVVHSYRLSPPKNPPLNEEIPSNGSKEFTFPLAEKAPFSISCATHTWMSGYQLVLDHPYGAVTDADGKFTITDLPSGSYTFIIWHEKAGTIRDDFEVEVAAGDTPKDLGKITLNLSQFSK